MAQHGALSITTTFMLNSLHHPTFLVILLTIHIFNSNYITNMYRYLNYPYQQLTLAVINPAVHPTMTHTTLFLLLLLLLFFFGFGLHESITAETTLQSLIL